MKIKMFTAIISTALLILLQSCQTTQPTVKKEVVVEKKVDTKVKKELTEKEKYEIKKNQSFGYQKIKQKKYEAALPYFDKVLAADTKLEVAKKKIVFWRAECLQNLGKMEESIKEYQRYATLVPEDKNVRIKLEYIFYSNGEILKAIKMNEELSKLDPENFSYLKKIGRYYFEMIQKLAEANEEDPQITEYAVIAIEWLEKYLEKVGNDNDVQGLSTMLIQKYMDKEKLKIKYEQNLVKNPNDFKTMAKLATFYLKEDNTKKANDLLVKVYAAEPQNLKVLKMLIKINKNNVNKSIELNRKALELDKANERYNLTLAKLYIEKKRYKDARNMCKAALRKNPNSDTAYKIWADIYNTAVSTCADAIEYQDKLVFIMAYRQYKKAGKDRKCNSMKENGQVPSKSDYFTNRGITRPSRSCYKWINPNWEEVKYIDEFLKNL